MNSVTSINYPTTKNYVVKLHLELDRKSYHWKETSTSTPKLEEYGGDARPTLYIALWDRIYSQAALPNPVISVLLSSYLIRRSWSNPDSHMLLLFWKEVVKFMRWYPRNFMKGGLTRSNSGWEPAGSSRLIEPKSLPPPRTNTALYYEHHHQNLRQCYLQLQGQATPLIPLVPGCYLLLPCNRLKVFQDCFLIISQMMLDS